MLMSPALKGTIRRLAAGSGLLDAWNALRGRVHGIFTFHRVRPDGASPESFDSCPWISRNAFRALLSEIRRTHDIVSLAELCERRFERSARLAAITFDDGWRDNHAAALPVLAEMRIPATIFVCTGKIGSQDPFWQQRLGRCFASVARGEEDPASLRAILGLPSDQPIDRGTYLEVVARWKPSSLAAIEERMARLERAVPGAAPEERAFLDRAEIREMAGLGIEFGSHTVRHAILTRETEDVVERELLESRSDLERITGRKVDSLAYPDGAWSPGVVSLARRAGYRIGCTVVRARVSSSDDLLALPRIDADWEGLADEGGRLGRWALSWAAR